MTDKIDNFVVVPMYECDPNKNNNCPKDVCCANGGPCKNTYNKDFARHGTAPKMVRIHKDILRSVLKEEMK